MADGLALLFQLKAQNQASPVVKQLQGDIKGLSTVSTQGFKQMQAASTQSLAAISQSLTQVGGQLPLVGNAVSGLGSQMATLTATAGSTAGAVGIVAAGFIATAAAVVTLGQALFDVAKSTADFQGKMFDLSQQTGVAVETLSTLEVLAATTGGSIESLAQSLVVFQGNLDEAQDSGTKFGKMFKELGIDTADTETALRSALKALAAMPESFEQTNAAAELFGRRGGKQFLAVLKESHGDLDKATERLRELGIGVTNAEAKIADEFNDALIKTNFQIRALGAVIGKEVMPIVLDAIQDVSKALRDNKEAVDAVAGAAKVLAFLLATPLQGAMMSLTFAIRGATFVWEAMLVVLWPIVEAYNAIATAASKAKAAVQFFTGTSPDVDPKDIPSLGAGPSMPKPPPFEEPKKKTGGSRGGGGGKRDTALQDATQEAGLVERETLQAFAAEIAGNKRDLEEHTRTIEEFTRRAIELNGLQLDATINRITAESNALDAALKKKSITSAEYEFKQRELDLQAAKAHQEDKEEALKLESERDKKIAEARIAARKRELEIAEEADQRQIDRIKDGLDRRLIAESSAEKMIGAIVEKALQRKLEALEEERDAYGKSLEQQKDITAQIIRLNAERAESAEQTAKRVADARMRENFEAGEKGPVDIAPTNVVVDGVAPQLSLLRDLMISVQERMAEFSDFTRGTLIGSFHAMASAVGESVAAWALYGESIGRALKKALAGILAQIAGEAAIQAVLHVAYAIGRAAFGDFAGAGKHALAALKFGAVAAAAGLGARAVAGGSFSGGGGGSGGGSNDRQGGPEARRAAPHVRDIDRRGSSSPLPGDGVLTLKVPDGWLGGELKKDYDLNGVSRLLITSGG